MTAIEDARVEKGGCATKLISQVLTVEMRLGSNMGTFHSLVYKYELDVMGIEDFLLFGGSKHAGFFSSHSACEYYSSATAFLERREEGGTFHVCAYDTSPQDHA